MQAAVGARRALIVGAAVTLIFAFGTDEAFAQASATADTQALQQQLQQQMQQLQQQEAQLRALQQLVDDESKQQSATAASAQAATARAASGAGLAGRFDNTGFTLSSDDGANQIHFRGNISVDGRYYSDAYSPQSDDTWLVRKLRPTLEGTLENRYDFRIMPDFAQGKAILQDGWADARVRPWLVFQFGKFKAPVGLEHLQLEQFQRFIEASLPSDLLPYRELGAKLGGNIFGGVLNYDVGLFDGAVDGGSTDGNSVPDEDSTGRFTWEGRLFVAPFLKSGNAGLKKLGLGVAETYVRDSGIATTSTTTSLLAGYKTPGQQSMFSYRSDTATGYNNATIANGLERRLVPQLYYYVGPFGLMSEYVTETQQVSRDVSAAAAERRANLQNDAWQVQAYWTITGENEGYDVAGPSHPVGQGGFGAWELAVRYHVIEFAQQAFTDGANSFANPASAPSAAHAVGAAVNWYLTYNFKVQLDYEVTRFTGGAILGNRPAEHVLTSQFALAF
ncbi:MAG TPA: porin [Steroidobacteraceae bacterium]|jgi:phosphate-selective porin OprO/OprP|nr:porin [Steroidobacteraceae bacterium]